jgi:hypothetical protein
MKQKKKKKKKKKRDTVVLPPLIDPQNGIASFRASRRVNFVPARYTNRVV